MMAGENALEMNALEERAAAVFDILVREYPDTRPLLRYRSSFEFLSATILAAQCTDDMVNRVTVSLFARYPGAADLAAAEREELEEIIRPTGFYHSKAASLLGMAKALVDEHGGRVPDNVDALVKLPGVGRKTANVVLGHCFGRPAIIVDTHFKRVSTRLGLTEQTNPDRIEAELAVLVLEEIRTRFSMVVNFHGRYCCRARKPACPSCPVREFCPYPEKTGA